MNGRLPDSGGHSHMQAVRLARGCSRSGGNVSFGQLNGKRRGSVKIEVDNEVIEVSTEEDQPVRLKPVTNVYLGKVKFTVSSVEFMEDRITFHNMNQKPACSNKYNITLPYREIDAFRYCFTDNVWLVVIQPIYSSYEKLADFTDQRMADSVPENFVMVHSNGEQGHANQLQQRHIERFRRWADADCEKAGKPFSRGVKFIAIAPNFANTYLQSPNRSLKSFKVTSGVFNVTRATAAAPAKTKTPELIDLDDDDDEGVIVPSSSSSSSMATHNYAATSGSRSNSPAKPRLLDKVVIKFPPGDKNQISLYGRDLLCLRDGQYLNDNIVNFYLKHFQKNILVEHLRGRIFIYDALFATHLIVPKRKKATVPINHQNFLVFKVETVRDTYHNTLKAWTKNVDIFTKDYLFIPFIRDQHWFLVILCHIDRLLPRGGTRSGGGGSGNVRLYGEGTSSRFGGRQQQPVPEKKATIIFMDSLNKHNTLDHSPSSNTAALLKYLECEYREKYNDGEEKVTSLTNYEVLSPKVPQQTNFYDCGLFALEYIERFLKDPEEVLKSLKGSASSLTKWFEPRDLKMKRSKIYQTIVNLMPPDDVKLLEEELDELQASRGETLPPASASFYEFENVDY